MVKLRRLGLLLQVLISSTVFCAYGQEIIDSGSMRVVLPSKEWVRVAERPARETLNQVEARKLLISAEAYKGKLKLRVTEFDYPTGTTDQKLADLMDRIRNGYQTQAFGMISETPRQVGGFPVIDMDIRCKGWKSMRARTFLCANKACLVEIGGSREYQAEADQCWNGITLKETPMDAVSFAKLAQMRQKTQADILARVSPPSQAGVYIAEFAALIGGVVILLWISIRAADKLRLKGFNFSRKHRRRRRKKSLSVPVATVAQSHQ